jgi:Ca-activated chloride channel family protein
MKITTWALTMLVFSLLAVFASASSTGQITGRVLDANHQPVAGATVVIEGTRLAARTAGDGTFTIPHVPAGTYTIRVEAAAIAPMTQRVTVTAGQTTKIEFGFTRVSQSAPETEKRKEMPLSEGGRVDEASRDASKQAIGQLNAAPPAGCYPVPAILWQSPGSESYDTFDENEWLSTLDKPLSTFSIDVDAASYGNVRRFLTQGQLPPTDAVRIEELVNYFDYDYPDPRGRHPFSITTEVAETPWNRETKLVHIGLQGARVDVEDLPPSNLVFLIDVSGSMNQPNKLPLLQSSLGMLVDNLRPQDRVAIVVYAGAAGLVLPSTCGSDKETILRAIEGLQAGGSTAGGAGLQLAYHVAQQNFMEEGNNRIILATDGDFNVGMSSDGEMVRLIEDKRRTGVFLTVLGFGEGNLQDSKMEKLADKGNGHYAYIDNLIEARKVLVNEMGATLLTIAKDVKLQVEFNPARVESYRLIGYENRALRDRDFDDDTKDAGEIGAGHSVTALYEITLTDRDHRNERPRKYSDTAVRDDARRSSELLTVSFRYKEPTESQSRLLSVVVKDRNARFANASDDFQFSAAVALFGMLLRESPHVGNATMLDVVAIARGTRGEDPHGYRAEFVRLAETAQSLMTPALGSR